MNLSKSRLIAIAGVAAVAALLPAQVAAQQTLASTMEVYVFPTQGQSPSTQSQDESACYEWAVGNSGNDPFDLQKQAQQSSEQSAAQQQAAAQRGAGSAAKGAVVGAAGGALIGEIASNDPGKGAAWGAAVGALGGRRHRRMQQASAQQQIAQQNQSVQQSTAQQIENFKKAFSVCLEAKNYMVKF